MILLIFWSEVQNSIFILYRYEVAPRSDSEDSGSDEEEEEEEVKKIVIFLSEEQNVNLNFFRHLSLLVRLGRR